MKYRGVKIPKCNGRPQLWARGEFMANGNHSTIRIIYQNGTVHWNCYSTSLDCLGDLNYIEFWDSNACTTRDNQLDAIKASIDHDLSKEDIGKRPWFLGYL